MISTLGRHIAPICIGLMGALLAGHLGSAASATPGTNGREGCIVGICRADRDLDGKAVALRHIRVDCTASVPPWCRIEL
jgi:hypothetical protein